MMCFSTKEDNAAVQRNAEIEKMIRVDKGKIARQIKILLLGQELSSLLPRIRLTCLLLGAGESGKSTVLKQMRLIHAGGFSPDECKQWRVVIFNNLVQAFHTVLTAMYEFDVHADDVTMARDGEDLPDLNGSASYDERRHSITLGEPANKVRREHHSGLYASNSLFRSTSTSFNRIHRSTMISRCHDLASKLLLHCGTIVQFKRQSKKGTNSPCTTTLASESASSYFYPMLTKGSFCTDLTRFFEPDYIPTNQDILRARLRTTGISETIFELEPWTYRMFDVGGQRSERRKWINAFDNVQVVLFLVAISGYDQVLVEDRGSVSCAH